MEQRSSENIRNIALLDHEGAGETTLIESLLHRAGASSRMGHISEHNTISDSDSDERELEKSLYCTTLSFDYNGKQLNCLDVPGSIDAIAEAMTALHAVECALLCIDGCDGIKVNTRRMWRLAAKRGIPRIIAITRLNAENSDFDTTLSAIQAEFGARAIPLFLPNGAADEFTDLCSVLHGCRDNQSEISTYESVVEAIVETDDDLMDRYLEGETIPEAELLGALKQALLHGSLFPVIPTAGDIGVGAAELLELLCELAPAPGEVEHLVYQQDEPVNAIELPGFSGYVYHTEADEFVGRIAYIRVLSGSIRAHDTFINRRSGQEEKAAHIYRIKGREQQEIDIAVAGDLIAIPRIAEMQACDIITDGKTEITMDAIDFPTPMVSLAVRPKTNRDGQKLGAALHEFEKDDRTFHVHADTQTHDLIISGMSNMHLQLILSKLKRRYKVEVETATPRVPYMETATVAVTETEYTHKKQSGGAGQFARVVINIEPLPRGDGYAFVDQIHGGVIDAVFRPSVDKGVQAAMAEGVLAGYPVTDIKVTLTDGKTHPVDSKDIAFQTAGQKAFRKAFEAAKPVLLEPIVKMQITLPQSHIGDIMGDLNSRRGQILATEMKGEHAVVEALAPMAEIHSYQAQLKSMTGGEGSYEIEFDHYDLVPPHIQKRILGKS